MYNINYIRLVFLFETLAAILVAILTNKSEKNVPAFINQLWRYGKISYQGSKNVFMTKFEISKSYSKHYYKYALILTTCTTIFASLVLFCDFTIPHLWYDLLDTVGGSSRQANVSAASALLAMVLFTAHCYRRFYDTHFVCVFGRNGRMSLFVYLFGFTHYTGTVITILMESTAFAERNGQKAVVSWSDLNWVDLAATLLLLWADWHQYKANVIMANLRKNKKGTVVTHSHKLPHGDWFKYVSSPHMLAEILVYCALTIILRNNVTWYCVLLMVISNQVLIALQSHQWYKETFKDIPKHRKALIPFIY